MPHSVFAYIDPGTGSYVLQIALAGALGASYALRRVWARAREVFRRSAGSRG